MTIGQRIYNLCVMKQVMRKRILYLVIFPFSVFGFHFQGLGQSIPKPQAKVHCSYDGNWYTPEEYRIYCKPPGQTQQTRPGQTTGLSPLQHMQLQMFQSMLQPLFNSIFNLSSLFPKQDTSHQEAARSKQEEERKVREAWKKFLEEAEMQAKLELERKKAAGQEILSRVSIGSGPLGSYTIIAPRSSEGETSLSAIDWDNPRANSVLPGPSLTDEKAKEQVLKAAYFSKMAETALLNGDLEAARFWAGVAFEGDVSSPRVIDYKPPTEVLDAMDTKKTTEMNKRLYQYSRFFREALPEFDALQKILSKMDELGVKKKEKERELKEIEEQIRTVELQSKQARTSEERSQASDLLVRALSLKQQAEIELQNALQEEQRLMQEKQAIEKNLSEMKNKWLADVK